jgi:MoaA/NifB/PqqE/SkfB family radical SAM enzyme
MLNFIQIDFEATNRCNASCYFCPRDMTPHQGMMDPPVFEKSLERAIELRDTVVQPKLDAQEVHIALCGLGEPLLNKHLADYVRQVRDAGFYCSVSSNGALLDERRGAQLIEAGLNRIDLNVGDTGDVYEDVYKLPWETTRDNVVRFNEMAQGTDCQVQVVLVLHHDVDDIAKKNAHGHKMVKFWRRYGIKHFMPFNVMNRGGALSVDHMQYEQYAEVEDARSRLAARGAEPLCMAPFMFIFIGYDGQYYLCCSDWKKETPMGSVFDGSIEGVYGAKLEFVMSRETVCASCNLDPLNRLADEIRAANRGQIDQAQVDAMLDEMTAGVRPSHEMLEQLGLGDRLAALEWAPPLDRKDGRKLIPVVSEPL